MTDKIPLELTMNIFLNREQTITMNKMLYAGFIPQHGMEILDTEIFFRVRTTAMAGLQTLKHTAIPLRRGKFIEGNRKITSKMFPKDEKELQNSIEFFLKEGWKLDR